MAMSSKLTFAALSFVVALYLDAVHACSCAFTPLCGHYNNSDVVVHAKVLSRSGSSTASNVFTIDIITLFKVEPGVIYPQEITFTTPSSSAACGISPSINGEYIFGLFRTETPVEFIGDTTAEEAEFSASLCGLYLMWSSVDEEELTQCAIDPCDGACDELEECRQYERNHKWYCSEICADGACPDRTTCETKKRPWCRNSGFDGCPMKRACVYPFY